MIPLKFHWVNEPKIDKHEAEKRICYDLGDLRFPGTSSRLITHTVYINHDYNAPAIHVYGEEGDDTQFYCEWLDEVKWINGNGDIVDPPRSKRTIE